MSTMYLLLQGNTFQLNMSLFPYLPLMFGIRLIKVELHPEPKMITLSGKLSVY